MAETPEERLARVDDTLLTAKVLEDLEEDLRRTRAAYETALTNRDRVAEKLRQTTAKLE